MKHGDGATCTRIMSSFTDIVPNGTRLVETPDTDGAYPRLDDHQIATLEAGSSRRPVHTGELLVREGHRCRQDPRISVHLSREVRAACGDDELEAVVAENNRTGERYQIKTRSLFVFIGAVPNTAWLNGVRMYPAWIARRNAPLLTCPA